MLVHLGWFSLGLLLLVLGADSFVRGASGLALRFGIPQLIVGIVLVGFGTSAPELAVNLTAGFAGNARLAVGNVVGSNIANVGLILGIAALMMPLTVQMRLLRIEAPVLLLVYLLLWLLCLDGSIGLFDAGVLLAGFVAMAVVTVRDARTEPDPVQRELVEAAATRPGLGRNVLRVVIGLSLLLYASHLVVGGAVAMARLSGIDEVVVGLTVVAIGTSLPELATSVIAAWQKRADIAVGNVIGSCLFNVLLILGATALVIPLPVDATMRWVQLPVMLAFALVLYPMVRGDLLISRREGGVLVAGYAVFLAWQLISVTG
ncbi:MAG TPA: calcium/sodium antiporter [Xanthomonadaceae bacterium]|nr:calcium/sodium antiporter [Xanthomonadaceae bacterium]